MTSLKEILNEYEQNLKFREAFKQNPEKALAQYGYNVSAEDLEKIRAMFKLSDSNNEKLDDRINK